MRILISILSFFLSSFIRSLLIFFFFFFNDTATTEIYTLSLHDALPISSTSLIVVVSRPAMSPATLHPSAHGCRNVSKSRHHGDRKSTRLNSSHVRISYAVFCLKKKK